MLNQHRGGFQNEFYQNKREVNLNLPPQQNVGNVFGMRDTGPAVDQTRYIPGMYKTDEKILLNKNMFLILIKIAKLIVM